MSPTLRVMVVEDHDALRHATLSILQQAGFEAVGVGCAEDLDDSHAARLYDAFVIDLNLPGESGLSLAMRLRKALPQLYIVITTARTSLNDRVQGYEAGADIYMPKPVDPAELVAALKSLGARKKALDIQTQGLQLNPRQHLLAGPADKHLLAGSEVRLLLSFAHAPNFTLERWQVMSQLNPDGKDISSDSLQNRLSQLRKKIAQCGIEGESIKAQRGLGYQLCVPLVVV